MNDLIEKLQKYYNMSYQSASLLVYLSNMLDKLENQSTPAEQDGLQEICDIYNVTLSFNMSSRGKKLILKSVCNNTHYSSLILPDNLDRYVKVVKKSKNKQKYGFPKCLLLPYKKNRLGLWTQRILDTGGEYLIVKDKIK